MCDLDRRPHYIDKKFIEFCDVRIFYAHNIRPSLTHPDTHFPHASRRLESKLELGIVMLYHANDLLNTLHPVSRQRGEGISKENIRDTGKGWVLSNSKALDNSKMISESMHHIPYL